MPLPSCGRDTIQKTSKRLHTPSARSVRDEELKERIQEVYSSNYRVYGARKIWRELNRQEHAVARCTVERLMRELGITGAVRGRKAITTITDPAAERAPDLLDRDFVASAPNRCWVADLTHVATWNGVVYVAFVVTPSPVASSAGPPPPPRRPGSSWTPWRWPLWQRNRDGFPYEQGELIHHSDPRRPRQSRPSCCCGSPSIVFPVTGVLGNGEPHADSFALDEIGCILLSALRDWTRDSPTTAMVGIARSIIRFVEIVIPDPDDHGDTRATPETMRDEHLEWARTVQSMTARP
ncbi:IS3 family transposase [Streptomyces sp. NBC_00654]|uniref:IS3 family transposase n=1 Tax=Streptomyces sp. NBC_00654 TaxID=2975799 RepID=UPI002255FDDF|nr:IS3 family transposase [Streptomyces sp. NBC_00654]MCX4966960.1 IS3 family transposase [Streptomyces sp. NBC_00654]